MTTKLLNVTSGLGFLDGLYPIQKTPAQETPFSSLTAHRTTHAAHRVIGVDKGIVNGSVNSSNHNLRQMARRATSARASLDF